MNRNNGRSRKKVQNDKQEKRRWIVGGCALCAAILLCAGIRGTHRNSVSPDLANQETPGLNAPEQMPENVATASSASSEAATEVAGKQSATEAAQTHTEAVEEEKQQETYLGSLSGLTPGTILDDSQIDFSNLKQYFNSWNIEEGDNLYTRIIGKSWVPNDQVPLNSLVYLKMPHYNFDGQIQVGEMIVNREIEEDVKAVFMELFEEKYEIQSMYLIDNYWAGTGDKSDTASIDVNNTSAFCYRTITGGSKLSNHAYGKAIDLNPQQNPYVSYSSGKAKWYHKNANDYIDRSSGLDHVITHEDTAYKIFQKYGFTWGGDWNNPKDYQHFEKK